ncbi:MAG: hypothetical protein DMD34_07210 [Gemmatimonadetes bacterium]|nr:MAG: hypothetical protein DMD46_11050 [Gemmatimonadota bacterium]PYP95111.1 MAG: hypothetical protein DMD34_07210 [Gemmatimonadota bacterium]
MNGIERRLAAILTRGWWRLLVRGLVAIAFGVFTWLRPGLSLAALVLVFGIYCTADGVLGIWTAIAGRNDNDYWWVLLLAGIVGVGVGAVTFAAPGLTAVALLVYIAVWALVKGVLEIATAIRLRKEIQGEWLLVVGGAASVAFGALLLARPGAGVLAVLWLIAAYAVVFGVLLVLLAFRARRFVKEVAALGS